MLVTAKDTDESQHRAGKYVGRRMECLYSLWTHHLPPLPRVANHPEALWSSVETFWHEHSRSPDSHLDLLLIG